MMTRERFEQGMTLSQYVAQMRVNRDRFQRRLEAGQATRPLTLPGRKLNVLVITEDWCGDSLTHLPVLARMVEGDPDVELRVFLRDRDTDVMARYLKDGRHRAIPVFVFFDESMRELARLVERPPVPGQPLEDHLASVLSG